MAGFSCSSRAWRATDLLCGLFPASPLDRGDAWSYVPTAAAWRIEKRPHAARDKLGGKTALFSIVLRFSAAILVNLRQVDGSNDGGKPALRAQLQ